MKGLNGQILRYAQNDNAGRAQRKVYECHALWFRVALLDNPEDMSIEIEHIGFGSDRKFTPSHNTTFSAIALLYKFGGALRLSIFHNIYAKCPIDPSWLRRNTVSHFTLGPQVQGAFQEWLEI